MSSLTGALRTAQSGLLSTQSALDAATQNIANANTVGYSRKIVNYEQRVVDGAGAGVQISSITRKVDENLLRTYRQVNGEHQKLDVQKNYYSRMQDLFGKPGANNSISHAVSKLLKALETLSTTADGGIQQVNTVREAENMTDMFRDMSEQIQELRRQADRQITDIVSEIDALAKTVADLNDEIVANGATGRETTDLEDQRDQAINELSNYIDIVTFQRSDGDIVIMTRAGRTLVDSVPATLTHAAASKVAATSTHEEGDLDGIYIGAQIAGNDITNELIDGQLKGLVEQRDEILPNLQAQLDQYAATLRDRMNAIHNEGTAYPGLRSFEGTRRFIDPATQTIQLSEGDTRITLFNAVGKQQATTTLATIMLDNTLGTAAQSATGPWTVEEVGQKLEDWLQANGAPSATVFFDGDGQMNIEVNNTSLYLSFRDEVDPGSTLGPIAFNDNGANDDTISATPGTFDGYKIGEQITISGTGDNDGVYTITDISSDGSTISVAAGSFTAETDTEATFVRIPAPAGSKASPATINFNADGDTGTGSQGAAGYDEQVSGFSAFFGLNDFFVDDIGLNLYETDIVPSNLTSTAATLAFETAAGPMPGSPLSIGAGLTLKEVADAITAGVEGITATVVTEGSGSRLRIAHDAGTDFVITQKSSNTLLTDMKLHKADVNSAAAIGVRSDIAATPKLIAAGVMQWDAKTGLNGEYRLSVANDDNIVKIAETFNGAITFDAAGEVGLIKTSFLDYGAEIVARNASRANFNERRASDSETYRDSIKEKSDNISGVNLDEEMSNLIVIQQSYGASARVMTTIQSMFEALEQAF